jgi:predicted lipase
MTTKEKLLLAVELVKKTQDSGIYKSLQNKFKDKKSSIEGYTTVVSDMFVVVFAQTNNVIDWITNFLFRFKTMPYPASKGSKVKIHSGYVKGWMRLRNDIHERIKQSGKSKVFITGYSMGGGVAPIAALDIQYNFGLSEDQITCVAMEGPRVFNLAGIRSYAKRVPDTIRTKYGNDIVTKVPPPWSFKHVDIGIHFGPRDRWWKFSIKDHDTRKSGLYQAIQGMPD